MIWPSEAPLDVHRKYSLFAHRFNKALTVEEKAEQDARLAAEAQTAVEQSRKAADEAKIKAAVVYAEQYTMSRWSRNGSIWRIAVQEYLWHHQGPPEMLKLALSGFEYQVPLACA